MFDLMCKCYTTISVMYSVPIRVIRIKNLKNQYYKVWFEIILYFCKVNFRILIWRNKSLKTLSERSSINSVI